MVSSIPNSNNFQKEKFGILITTTILSQIEPGSKGNEWVLPNWSLTPRWELE